MKKPIVLVLENSIDVTGALKSITRTAYDLSSRYAFQFVIPRSSKGRFWIEGKGFTDIYELPLKELSRKPIDILLYLPVLMWNSLCVWRLVRRKSISLIHVNDVYNLIPVVLWVLGCRVPYVCHIRFLPNRFPKWLFGTWLKLQLRFASNIVAVSESVMKQIPHNPKIVVIPNELPVEERYPDFTAAETLKKSYTFLYLSNFINGKGQNYALEAFAKIAHDLPSWKLKFVGGDMGLSKNKRFRADLQRKATEMGLERKIEWEGFTENVEKEYKEADIVLNFSDSESFSITCLEALFFGRPVIATDCGGPSEIIDDGVTGFLVEIKNVDEMAKAMKQLAASLDLRTRMGTAAQSIVRSRFSVEKTSVKLAELYDTSIHPK